MKKQFFTIATGLSLSAAGLLAQSSATTITSDQATYQQMVNTFQQAGTLGTITPTRMPAMGGGRGSLVTGSPVTAKEINKTVQTLSDGTELENSQTSMFYRDSQGRTRIEPSGTSGMIVIVDPVAAVRITLNPATKTATRAAAPALSMGIGGGGGGFVTARDGGTVTYKSTTSSAATADAALKEKLEVEIAALAATKDKVAAEVAARGTTAKSQSNTTTENLGFQMQNGILAEGTRTTLVIPKGQIGNNRDIHVVNERWYSKDLQMVVKSVNSDPRFGTTTYDLTSIVQGADPSMFQIPGNYTVTEGPGRGGRGGALVPAVK